LERASNYVLNCLILLFEARLKIDEAVQGGLLNFSGILAQSFSIAFVGLQSHHSFQLKLQACVVGLEPFQDLPRCIKALGHAIFPCS
jgi:hypothetical protein